MDKTGTAIKETARRISEQREWCQNEEQTKQALILPMLEALGYDTHDMRQVRPEYVPTHQHHNRQERVDYAVFVNGGQHPDFLIEAKSVDSMLVAYGDQLWDYFVQAEDTRLGILTNGIDWWFFSDTVKENLMDSDPFYEISDVTMMTDDDVDFLSMFSRDEFDIERIRHFAGTHQGTLMREAIKQELASPSEEFVKCIIMRRYPNIVPDIGAVNHETPIITEESKRLLDTITAEENRTRTRRTQKKPRVTRQRDESRSLDVTLICEDKKGQWSARGKYLGNGRLRVLTGSRIVHITQQDVNAARNQPAKRKGIEKAMRERTEHANTISDDELYDDIDFASPSTASGFVVGRNDNGWRSWRDENGNTLDELLSK